MEKNYIVSIVYQKGNSFKLLSGMIQAVSAPEAIGKAVQMANKLGNVFLSSANVCDETKVVSFEEINNKNQ